MWDYAATPLTAEEVTELLYSAIPGETFPVYNNPPETSFTCEERDYPGFYADPETGCQIIRRCTIDGDMFSYLCANGTLFNQLYL